jgi:hypothetical protein
MADDNTLRSYRSNEPYRRSADQVDAQADDPLAELVRLIGQPDPYTDNAPRHGQRPVSRVAQPRREQSDESVGGWRKHVQRPNYETREEPHFDSDPRYGSADPHGATHRQAPPPSFATDHDPYGIASPRADRRYTDPGYDAPRYDAPRYEDPRYDDRRDDYRPESSYAVPTHYRDEPMFDAELRYGEPSSGRRADAGPRGEEDYDDPPRKKKRGSSLVTAAVLIGCAMLGTAGAYSYRTYMAGPGSTQAPVIIADTSPSKVVPNERKPSRSQERVGGQGGDERLVSREEQPVNLQTPGGGAVPRVVFPSPVQPAPSATGSTPAPRASNAQADQPKPVKTLTIRPDGGNGATGQPFGDVPAQNAAPPAARSAFPPPPAARASRDEPLSLNPAPPAQVNEPRQAPRAQSAPSEPRLASIPPASASGGYMVQVSSQRSESDAQASFRALQEKYSQLRSRQLVVRRADLGSRGIYFRAMVGPFGSSEEANQLCSSLKQSGGQCIVQRN